MSSSAKQGETGTLRPLFIVLAVVALLYGIIAYVQREDGEPMPLPDNGTTWEYQMGALTTAPMKIVTDKKLVDTHVLVLVSDWKTSVPVMSMFVLGGREAEVMLPVGTYRVSLARGNKWYGIERLFGRRTEQVEGIKPVKLYRMGPYQTMGTVLNFNERIDGNFPLNPKGHAISHLNPVAAP